MRTCVVCGGQRDKRTLTRLVYGENGLEIDPTGKREGRGAYLCEAPSCWRTAAESQVLNRALRISLSDADRQRIHQDVVS